MDVCPVHALDMTRATGSSIESGAERRDARSAGAPGQDWMMEFPVQVSECVGCQLCATECPTSVITIAAAVGRAALERPQGPITHAPEGGGWVPLSAFTHEALSEPRGDPWGVAHEWRPVNRPASWQTWRSWGDPATARFMAPCQEACPVGT
ncbi:MAG TPA: 4Fe-4S binding protein, partial [Candidatus Limnocylindria bacterium]